MCTFFNLLALTVKKMWFRYGYCFQVAVIKEYIMGQGLFGWWGKGLLVLSFLERVAFKHTWDHTRKKSEPKAWGKSALLLQGLKQERAMGFVHFHRWYRFVLFFWGLIWMVVPIIRQLWLRFFVLHAKISDAKIKNADWTYNQWSFTD